MNIRAFNTIGYSRFLQERVSEAFPGVSVELEDEMEFKNGIYRLRTGENKILIPAGNYGAMNLTETVDGSKRIVGRTLVSTVLVLPEEEVQLVEQFIARVAGFNYDGRDESKTIKGNFVSVYITPEVERF